MKVFRAGKRSGDDSMWETEFLWLKIEPAWRGDWTSSSPRVHFRGRQGKFTAGWFLKAGRRMPLLPTWVLGLFDQQKLIKGQQGIQVRLYWDSCCITRGQEQVEVPLVAPRGCERVCPLNAARMGTDGWVGLEGWLMGPAHPLGAALCRDHEQDPALAPGASEVAVGLVAFLYLVIHNLPQLYRHAVIFSPF